MTSQTQAIVQGKSLPRTYISFLIALMISRMGDSFYSFALPWISYELTHSVVVMSSLYGINVLPILLFGPVTGVWVDRWDRKKLMLSTDTLSAFLIGLILVLHLFGWLQLWQLYAVSFVLAALSLLFDVSLVAVIPQMAGLDLNKSNAAYQFVTQAATLVGPMISGVLLAAIGGFSLLGLDALSFAATFVAVWRLPLHHQKESSQQQPHLLKGMKDGLQWLLRDKINFSLSLQAMVSNFGYSTAASVLMYYMLSRLHLDAEHTSFNYALIGVGGLLASIIVVPLAKRWRRGILITGMIVLSGCGFTWVALGHFWLAPGIGFALVSICNVGWNILVQSLRQETIPTELFGRVLSFSRVCTRLAMPLGAFVGGYVSSSFPIVYVFVIAASGKIVEILISLLTPLRKL